VASFILLTGGLSSSSSSSHVVASSVSLPGTTMTGCLRPSLHASLLTMACMCRASIWAEKVAMRELWTDERPTWGQHHNGQKIPAYKRDASKKFWLTKRTPAPVNTYYLVNGNAAVSHCKFSFLGIHICNFVLSPSPTPARVDCSSRQCQQM